ncbi:hypothetical protein HN873_020146 [Arachis hypogaea]
MEFNRYRLVEKGVLETVYKRSLQCGGDVAVKRFANVDGLDCLLNPFVIEFATRSINNDHGFNTFGRDRVHRQNGSVSRRGPIFV